LALRLPPRSRTSSPTPRSPGGRLESPLVATALYGRRPAGVVRRVPGALWRGKRTGAGLAETDPQLLSWASRGRRAPEEERHPSTAHCACPSPTLSVRIAGGKSEKGPFPPHRSYAARLGHQFRRASCFLRQSRRLKVTGPLSESAWLGGLPSLATVMPNRKRAVQIRRSRPSSDHRRHIKTAEPGCRPAPGARWVWRGWLRSGSAKGRNIISTLVSGWNPVRSGWGFFFFRLVRFSLVILLLHSHDGTTIEPSRTAQAHHSGPGRGGAGELAGGRSAPSSATLSETFRSIRTSCVATGAGG
jgi:hypothetical protein